MDNIMDSTASMIKLTDSNYSIWKTMMEDFLFYNDLYDPVEGDSAKPSEMSDKDWEKLNRKTVAAIRQCVDISVFHQVAEETSAHLLWKKLETLHERKVTFHKFLTVKKLMNLKYKEGESVVEHCRVFDDIIDQLSTMNVVLDDELQALFLLSSLPHSWENLVSLCSNSTPDGKLNLQKVKECMLSEEISKAVQRFRNCYAAPRRQHNKCSVPLKEVKK